MELSEFVKEYKRMCSSLPGCESCKLYALMMRTRLASCKYCIIEYPDNTERIVSEWVAEQTVKTRQSEFLKICPDAKLDTDGVVGLFPCNVVRPFPDKYCRKGDCSICRKEFWLGEIEKN